VREQLLRCANASRPSLFARHPSTLAPPAVRITSLVRLAGGSAR
jgi:hypothetical protein